MLENINYALFALINATPASPQWAIEVAILIAKDLILIVPLLVVTLWLWGPAQRQMVFKLMLALIISLTVSWAIGHLYPHDRPFVAGVGYNFLHHAADDSFPSDHGTVSFTFALAFLFWHRLWSGALLMAIAAAIAVAAIAFGYLREANDKEAEMQYLEQPADPQPATDTGAATPEQPITE